MKKEVFKKRKVTAAYVIETFSPYEEYTVVPKNKTDRHSGRVFNSVMLDALHCSKILLYSHNASNVDGIITFRRAENAQAFIDNIILPALIADRLIHGK